MYVVDLVAPGTVNTMPESTLVAMADHGKLRGDTVRSMYQDAQSVLDSLEELGVSYDDVVGVLEREGVEKFSASWTELIRSIDEELGRLART
jgi:transaldolase